ncbi:MAG: hypothetical protein IH825_08870, partial [Candidatus Marinimicrobia bacterium]|nr:hypothetical protein [Candidatus Neomarinimicrobiota bacterium]
MKKILMSLMASLAIIYGSIKSAHATFDGTPSTGSLTVVNVFALEATTATGSLTVIETTGSVRARVTVGFAVFAEGRDWFVGATTVTAATSLAAAINSKNIPVTASFAGENTPSITLTAIDEGTLYNGISLKTSTPTALSVSASTLLGGQDDATILINKIPLLQGRDWFIQDVASNTAVNLAAAINHNLSVSNLVSASWLGDESPTVLLRSVLSPVAFTLESSAPSDLTVSGDTMTGGADGNITPSLCFLGSVNDLPTNGYPAGCTLFLKSEPTSLYLSTEAVSGPGSWSKTSEGIADGAVTTDKIASDAVTSSKILAGAVTTPKLGADSVTTPKIINGAVTPAKIISDRNGINIVSVGVITVNGGEDVGIGVSSPRAELHIQRTSDKAILLRERVDSSVVLDNPIGRRSIEGGEDGISNEVGRITVDADGDWSGNSSPTRMEFHTTPSGAEDAVERVRINEAGNVGIATTNPTEKLFVVGNASFTGVATANIFNTSGSSYKVNGVVVIDGNRNLIVNNVNLSNSVTGADFTV